MVCPSSHSGFVTVLKHHFTGSSSGRAPRCAAWFTEYVLARNSAEGIPENMAEPACFVLEGGIKGWVAGGPPFRALVDGYDEAYWLQFAEVKTAGKRLNDGGGDEMETDSAADAERMAKRKIMPLPNMTFQ